MCITKVISFIYYFIVLYHRNVLYFVDKQANFNQIQNSDAKFSAEEGFGFCGHLLIGLSYFMLIIGMPFTLCCCMKVKI